MSAHPPFGAEPKNRYRQATPDDVEQRLYSLGKELDEATIRIQQAEAEFLLAKADFEIAFARSYMRAQGSNMKAREAMALVECAQAKQNLVNVEALLRAEKENARRIYAHVDIARSVSVIVRAGIGAS